MKLLNQLLDELPEELERQVFTHASWTERRDECAWRRWICVLGRSRAGRSAIPSIDDRYATLPASLPSLPCALIGALL
jgi:hypothetical protein